LSKDFNDNHYDGALTRVFFSKNGLEEFKFDGGNETSNNEFSMFRLEG